MATKRLHSVCLTTALILLGIIGAWALLNSNLVQAAPGVLYVAPGGNCGGASPCHSTIQSAVDAALPGDEIRVAAGTYPIQSGLDQVVLVDKNLTLRGGYTTNNWDTPDPDSNATIVNALSQGRVMVIDNAVDATIEGVRLEYGNSTDLGDGGGVYAEGASVTLRHTWITTNTAPSDEFGGGIYVSDGTLVVESSIIQANTAGSGGGLRVMNSQATIQNSQIVENGAIGNPVNWVYAVGGAGVLVGGTSHVTMTGNVVRDNETGFVIGGGGIMLLDSTGSSGSGMMTLYLFDNLIEGNYAGRGGGVLIDDDQLSNDLFVTAEIISNTIRDNSCYRSGAGIAASADVTITHNTIANNHAGILGSTIEYGNGGGMSISGKALIEHNLIQNNDAKGIGGEGKGGGAYLNGNDSITFRHNEVSGNLASGVLGGRGGGIYITGDNVIVEANLIQRNSATGGDDFSGGGGIHISRGDARLDNNIVIDNSVGDQVTTGSGMTIAGCRPTISHNTFANNSGGGGQGIYVVDETDPGQPILFNTIVASQTIGIQVNNRVPQNTATLYGVLWWSNGSNYNGTAFAFDEVTGPPAFANPAGADYHLGPGSAAIDAGRTDAGIGTDMDGQARPHYGGYDLGADELWAVVAIKTATPDRAEPGDIITYTLTLTNATIMPITVRLTDTLPSEVEYVGPITFTGGSAGLATRVITWTGTVPTATPIRITWPVQVLPGVSAGTTITNTAIVSDAYGLFQTNPALVAVPRSDHYIYLPLALRQ